MKILDDTKKLSHGAHDHGAHGQEHVDAWHHHDAAEGEPQEEHLAQVNTHAIAKWFVIIVLSVVASIVFIVIYFNHFYRKLQESTVETVSSVEYLGYKSQSMSNLSLEGEEKWKGLAGNKVQAPIGRALDKVADKYKGGALKLSGAMPAGHPSAK